MGGIQSSVCGIYQRSSVYFPVQHYIQYRPSGFDQSAGAEAKLANVKLNTVEHNTVEKLCRFLLEVFEIKTNPSYHFVLKYTTDNLTDDRPLFCDFLPNTDLSALVMNARVSFIFYYQAVHERQNTA